MQRRRRRRRRRELRRGPFCVRTFCKGCKASEALPSPVEPLPRDSEPKRGCTVFISFRFIKCGALVPFEDRPENPDSTFPKVHFQFRWGGRVASRTWPGAAACRHRSRFQDRHALSPPPKPRGPGCKRSHVFTEPMTVTSREGDHALAERAPGAAASRPCRVCPGGQPRAPCPVPPRLHTLGPCAGILGAGPGGRGRPGLRSLAMTSLSQARRAASAATTLHSTPMGSRAGSGRRDVSSAWTLCGSKPPGVSRPEESTQ